MKQTEIGLIPDDWEVKNINKECTIKARIGWQGLKSNEYLDFGDYVLITGTDFDNGFINWKSCNYVSEWRFKQDKNIQIKQGDVLITKDGTIGKVAFLDAIPMKGTLNSGVFVIRPKSYEKIDTVFLSLIFKSIWFDSFLEQITSGSTIVHLYQKDFVTFNFPIPPTLTEQQRIAKALSDVDALISTTEKLIQKKKNIKQGAMQNLLTGKKRLPGFGPQTKSPTYKQTELGPIPEDWEVKSLDELCSLITKQTGFDYSATIKPSLVLEHQKNTLPFIQNKDFEEERINFETDFYIPITVAKKFPKIYLNEDVLLISISGRIGNVAYFKHTQDAFIGGAVGIAHFYDKDNINYCMRYLLSPNGQMQIFAYEKSGAQHNLTIADVRKLSIPMPKDNKELNAIANVLSSMDREIETLNTKLEKYRNLKTAMMQQLLTGKIRLVK